MIQLAGIAPYIGFTESEVKKLCHQSGMPFSEMQRWYDGYQFTRNTWEDGKRKHLFLTWMLGNPLKVRYRSVNSDKSALIIELKWDKNAETAINQIKD